MLSELCTDIIDCPHSSPVWTTEGKLVIRNYNIKNGRLDLTDKYYTNEKTFAERNRRAKPRFGDLIITREAPMGEVCLVPDGLDCCLGQRMVLIRPDSKKCDSRYLLYSLTSAYLQKQIKSSENSGSIVSNLRIPLLKELLVPTATINEQKKIADVLSTLDTKIELNNKINAELEGLAKLVYDYWFVQFDFPNAEGKPYRQSGGKMRYDEVLRREVPEGWEVKELSSFVECNKWTLKGELTKGIVNYLDTSSLTTNVISGIQSINCENEELPIRARRLVGENDILYSTVRPVQKHFGIIKKPLENMIASTGFAQLRSTNKAISNDFVYQFLTSEIVVNRLQQIAESAVTSYPSISPNDILGLKLALPKDLTIILTMSNFLDSIQTKIANGLQENQHLSDLRDWLLPLLMNGQVGVG